MSNPTNQYVPIRATDVRKPTPLKRFFVYSGTAVETSYTAFTSAVTGTKCVRERFRYIGGEIVQYHLDESTWDSAWDI